jgi:hypothetical protein
MSNKQQQHIIPHLRTFQISLFDEKSKLEINRIFESSEKILPNKNDNIPVIHDPNFLSPQQQQIKNPVNYSRTCF